MILCPVCGKGNGDLEVTCLSCHSYLQAKVDALDLFATVWGVIESPLRTFKRIALATHKNYTLILASLFGISWTFMALRVTDAGLFLPNLFLLILIGVLGGPLFGIFALIIAGAIGLWLGARLGGGGAFRNAVALTSYAGIPVVLSPLFVLPIEIGIFGLSLFGLPPSPWELKPAISFVLSGLNLGLLIWFGALLTAGLSVALGLKTRRALVVALLLACCLGSLLFLPGLFGA